MTREELTEAFSFLPAWEDKYRYLIELGETLPPMSAELKNAATKVDGCMAQVWMAARKDGDRYMFQMDSDAHIVRGLQGILYVLVNGKTAAEIGALDFAAIFERLGLSEHLSPNRRNGFQAMVQRIRTLVG